MRKIFLSLALFICLQAYSQTCTVATDALKGTYEGDCKKDKADGKGTAKGEDSYTGEFKNGYPDGNGKYTWKNGDWFNGQWKKGAREGQGTMHYAEKDPGDSLTGFWKKDKYIGRYEKPYIVYSKTGDVVGLTISKENDKDKEMLFTIKTSSGGAIGTGGQAAKIAITDIQVLSGSFMTRSDDNAMPSTSRTVIRGIEFPIRMKVTLESEIIELEILEAGKYSLDIKINK